MKKILVIVLLGMSLHGEGAQPWAWNYSKYFSSHECFKGPVLYLRSEDMGHNPRHLFSQLVFSWNAFRPEQGFFRFSARVRCTAIQQWSPWYTMMEWGAGVQRSFVKKGIDEYSEYLYVRLEMLKGCLADNFQMRVEGINGADLNLLTGVSVCVSRLAHLVSETKSSYASLASIAIEDVPRRSQMVLDHPCNKVICSPTSLSMVVHYLTKKEVDPVQFAEGAFDTGLGVYGSWPFNVAHAYERSGGKIAYKVARLSSFEDLYAQLVQGIPVVVSVRGELAGAPQPYPSGHLLVVVGYDASQGHVLCHDPAHGSDAEVAKGYDLGSFMAAWEKSYRLSYIAQPLTEESRG
jgi:Peptidase_C39 like family